MIKYISFINQLLSWTSIFMALKFSSCIQETRAPSSLSFVLYYSILFWVYTWQCSRFIPIFVVRDYMYRVQGCGIRFGLVTCKAIILSTELSPGPFLPFLGQLDWHLMVRFHEMCFCSQSMVIGQPSIAK